MRTTGIKAPAVEPVRIAFLIGDKVEVTSVSGPIESILGWTAEDVSAGRIDFFSRIHPDDQDIFDHLLSTEVECRSETANVRIRTANGRITCFRISYQKASAQTNLRLSIAVWDAKQLNRTMMEAASLPFLRTILENTDDYIYFKDRNHVFTGASQTLVSLCDPAEHWTELIGVTDYDVFPEEYADFYYRLEKQVFSGVAVAHEIQKTRTKDGIEGWVDNRKYPIKDENDEIIGLYGIARDVTSQIQAQDSLRQERDSTRNILDTVESMIVALDLDGSVSLINRKGCELLGYTADELVGRNWFETCLPPEEDIPEIKQVFHEALNANLEGAEYYENKVLTRSGQTREIAWHNSVIRGSNGEIIGTLSAGDDITEREELHRRIEKIATHVPGVIFQYQQWPDGRTAFPYASKGISDIYGVDPEQVQFDATPVFQVLHPDDFEQVRSSMLKSFASLDPWHDTYRVQFPDGRVIWVEGESTPESQDDGSVLWHGYIRDVTERKALEEELRISQERFMLAMNGSNDGLFDWNLENDHVYYSPRYKSMLGYEEHELENSFRTWARLVDPNDKKRGWSMMRDYMDGRRNNFQLEFKMQHKHGHWVDILSRAYLVRDSRGRPIRVVGTHVDITAQKQAQLKIEAERNRAQHYLDVAGVILVALDRDGCINLINRKGCEILGLPEDQLIGMHWISNFVPEEAKDEVENIFKTLIAGNNEAFEYVETNLLTTRGELRRIAWYNSVIRDNVGRLTGSLSSGEDITDRLRAQRQVRDERNFLQNVIDSIEDPILVISDSRQVLRMNRSAMRLATAQGLPSSNVKCHQVTHQSAEPCVGEHSPCPLQQVIESGRSNKVVHRHFATGEDQRTYEVAATPLRDNDGKVAGIIEVTRDLTEHQLMLDKLKASESSYAHLAQHDPLTGLPNRLLFSDRLDQSIRSCRRHKHQLAVLYIDLDGFKQINDSFDHSIGDEVLKEVASRFKARIREEDTIARMGGDEFALLMQNIADSNDPTLIAREILEQFNEPYSVGMHRLFLGASIGIAVFPDHGKTVDELVRNADAAMYRAKEEGRKTFQYYTEELTAKAFERVLLESSLRNALAKEQLVLHYQAQIDTMTRRIIGWEALVRWRHPEMGLVSPVKFIALAEQTGLIVPIGEWVLREACRQMRAWQKSGTIPDDVKICVNVSGRQFDQPGLVEIIESAIKESGLPPENLEIEVTESTVARSEERTVSILEQLRDIGIKVAIDDFGTGFSSLSYLKKLPITKLKIDRSLISDIPNDENEMAISSAIIAMGKRLSLETLAEGVETSEQLDFLVREGCDHAQGFWFSKPQPAEEAVRLYDSSIE